MQSQAQPLISLFRTIVLAALTALLITSAALPMAAQNSVPATAVQAARMPQFASRLAPPATPRTPRRHSPQPYGAVYDNGPVNGQVDAWTLNFGFVTTNSIQLNNRGNGGSTTAVNFYAWLIPGDTITNVQFSIGSSAFGSDQFNGVVSLTQSDCFINSFGYNVCLESGSMINGPTLNGNYWMTLQNANVPSGDPVYWDENSGVGCQSPGCPSEAQENTVGTIPSEAFSILGSTTTCESPSSVEEKPVTEAKVVTVPPSPTQSYRVIYNFTGGADGAFPYQSLVVDAAGNLYGTNVYGGPLGGGTAFKLTPGASGWRFTRLYSFANNYGPDSPLVLSADGRLIGTTVGSGGMGDGTIFSLSPPGSILPTVFSNWMETLLYNFTGGSDGAMPGGSLVLDSSGNIYGNAAAGGAHSKGTLFEFTNGGIQVLHAFSGPPGDGANPGGVVNGSNGLYGITAAGGQYAGGTLYTSAGGYQVLHSFMPDGPDGIPTSLTTDQAGNLYGAASYVTYMCVEAGGYEAFGFSQIFNVSPPGWNPFILTSLEQFGTSLSSWVSTDASGNLYGTTDHLGEYALGNVFKLSCCWNYTDLHDFTGQPNDGMLPSTSPVVDAQGNIYGTTTDGGAYGYGVVWEISP